MTVFVLAPVIPLDIWRELKTYLVHNIKTQAKHMKNKKDIINFNKVLRCLPRIQPPSSGPRIIYNSVFKRHRFAKFLYHTQAFKPDTFKSSHRGGLVSVVVCCKLTSSDHSDSTYDYNKHFASCAVSTR
jgi:hypothetical protein